MVPDENKEDQEDTEGVLYKMISRNKWESVFTDKIPRKYSNDTGLGHKIESWELLDNKKKVCTKEPTIKMGFISKKN